jgi:sugar lactone lactonase YvrE
MLPGVNNGFYLVEAGNSRLWHSDGVYWTGLPGPLDGFHGPEAVTATLDDRVIYVADTGANRILRWAASDWTVVAGEGTGENQVMAPKGLAVDASGNLYVADTGNHRVLRFGAGAMEGGQILAAAGSGPSNVQSPEGLVVDGENRLIVADTGNNRILRLPIDTPVEAGLFSQRVFCGRLRWR